MKRRKLNYIKSDANLKWRKEKTQSFKQNRLYSVQNTVSVSLSLCLCLLFIPTPPVLFGSQFWNKYDRLAIVWRQFSFFLSDCLIDAA